MKKLLVPLETYKLFENLDFFKMRLLEVRHEVIFVDNYRNISHKGL